MSRTSKVSEALPADAIPSREAEKIAGCSRFTLVRWADAGRLRRFARPGFKRSAAYYSRAEVEALRPRRVSA